jgi:Mrp family chromosome partitioning ATPase
MRKPERMARTTPTVLNCGGSVTSFAAAEVVAEAVAETVLLEVDIGGKQVQAALRSEATKPASLASD